MTLLIMTIFLNLIWVTLLITDFTYYYDFTYYANIYNT
jgi:hypothetical protein